MGACRRRAGVYSAFSAEGRALNKEESAVADAALGLADSTTAAGDPGWDSASSGDEEGGTGGEVLSSAALQHNPLLALQGSTSGQFLTEHNQERLLSNSTNLQLSFLWGGTAPNGIKHTTSCVVRTIKSVWLFDCGEDTQRHLTRCGGPGCRVGAADCQHLATLTHCCCEGLLPCCYSPAGPNRAWLLQLPACLPPPPLLPP